MSSMNTIPKELILKQISVGPMGNFTYLIGDADCKKVMIVDPGWDPDTIVAEVKKNDLTIIGIILTHGHYDHVQALGDILKEIHVPVYISEQEPFKWPGAKIIKLKDNETIQIGAISLSCIHTPGHSPGCMCFLYKNILLTGDTLFIDGCGRCDLPGGNSEEMFDSLHNKIGKLPDNTLIFSGHAYGPKDFDSLGNQKKTNYFLRADNKNIFK